MSENRLILTLILYLTIIVSSCKEKSTTKSSETSSKKTLTDSLQNFSITKVTEYDFLKAKGKLQDQILYDTALYKKNKGIIKLPTEEKWHPFVVFTDTLTNTDDTNVRQYHYFGQLKEIGFYIIEGNFWEHYDCYLIDKATGKKTTIWNIPTISPNNKFIADIAPSGLDGDPIGLQIWNVAKNENNLNEPPTAIEKYLELNEQIWEPADLVWNSNNSLILKVSSIDNYNNEKIKNFYYLLLKF